MNTKAILFGAIIGILLFMTVHLHLTKEVAKLVKNLTSRIEVVTIAQNAMFKANIKMRDKWQRQYDTIFEMYRYEMSESTAVNRDREERDD